MLIQSQYTSQSLTLSMDMCQTNLGVYNTAYHPVQQTTLTRLVFIQLTLLKDVRKPFACEKYA